MFSFRQIARPVIGPRKVEAIVSQITDISKELEQSVQQNNARAIELRQKAAEHDLEAARASRVAEKLTALVS